MTTVGFIGSGQIGSAIAALAIEAGHQVVLSNSRGPETLADLAAELGPRACAASSGEAAAAGDIVVVTVPPAGPPVPSVGREGPLELAFFRCWSPRRVTLPELAAVAGARWE